MCKISLGPFIYAELSRGVALSEQKLLTWTESI